LIGFRSNEDHTVFGISAAVGIAITFLIKKSGDARTEIRYIHPCDIRATREEKFAFLQMNRIEKIQFDLVHADKRSNWINLTNNDYASFLPIGNKKTKTTNIIAQVRLIFRLYSLGLSKNRDEWLYDLDRDDLEVKIKSLIARYDRIKPDAQEFPEVIKWSRNLKRRLHQKRREAFASGRIVRASYRPYMKRWLYQSDLFIDEAGALAQIFPPSNANAAIFVSIGQRGLFGVCASDIPVSLDFFVPNAACLFPRWRFAKSGNSIDNITDWTLEKFRAHYEGTPSPARGEGVPSITKDAIFHYVYGLLHDPIYREKYALNLKREFPHIPFYADFWKWADWGEKLMALHIGYETVEPWPLKRIDAPEEKSRKTGFAPKAMLRANKESGNIQLDSETQLTSVPPEAWTYRLGNRSALEWILDQYKEKTPKDPTIREKFNTYRFADHKEKVIDLLKRVTRVSVETVEIVEAMRTEKR
jgi:predicted helicase